MTFSRSFTSITSLCRLPAHPESPGIFAYPFNWSKPSAGYSYRHYQTIHTTIPTQSSRNMATTTHSPQGADYGNFKLLQSFPVKYAPITLQRWRSEKTGLTVVLGSHATPIVSDLCLWVNSTDRFHPRPVDTSPLRPRVNASSMGDKS